VTSTSPERDDDDDQAPQIDTSVPHQARVYNYWLGGKDHFEADRISGDLAAAANPDILPGVRANRDFLVRAVRFLAAEARLRQFLDIGTGIPTSSNTHEVAQAIAPASRIVYVDNDPIVLAHARALLTSTPAGACAYLDADANDPAKVLALAADTLDLSRPVAVIMLLILHVLGDANAVVAEIARSVPSGSYLVISIPASDIDAERQAAAADLLVRRTGIPVAFRSKDEVRDLFTRNGLELIDPGVTTLDQWRPIRSAPPRNFPAYAAVGRKP
jgi:SAM-dependent methyltransferase